jgi:hypothetical protein
MYQWQVHRAVVTFIIGARLNPKKEVLVPAKFIFAAGVALFLSTACFAPPLPQYETNQDPAQKEMQDRMFKEANKKRQEDIRHDTEKLFQLATELKAAVDKSNENLLSLDVVRKADEVEKLAKKVKDKMKEALGPTKGPEPQKTLPGPYPR